MVVFSHTLIDLDINVMTITAFGRSGVTGRQGLLRFNLAVDTYHFFL
jgi:hypothetical protein